jgi:DNA/RNA-binding domain of Phe-tRNA-synthetase-like protein
MMFLVAEDCLALGLRAGAIVFRQVHVGPSSPALRSEILQEAQTVPQRFASRSAIRSCPQVAKFQEIHQAVGVNPRKEQSSIERLLTLALKRADLPAINSLVDAYNLVSLRSTCSLGAHDVDRIASPVTLRRLNGTEAFTPLGQVSPAEVGAGEFGYVDGQERLLCRLDVVQADFSKVTANTLNALLIIEGNTAHTADVLRQTFADAIELVTRHCGGTAEIIAFPPV